MKKIALLLFTILLLSCNKHERNCADFKTGKFEFVQDKNIGRHLSVPKTFRLKPITGKPTRLRCVG